MTHGHFVRSVALAVTLLCGTSVSVRAEVFGPLLPRKAIEMGLTARNLERAVEYDDVETTFTQNDTPVTIRYGITATATASFLLSGSAVFQEEDDPVFYTVGAGIQALIWNHSGNTITIAFSYERTLAIDQIEPKKLYREQFLDWTLFGQRSFNIHDQELTVWLGPLVSYFSVTPQHPAPENYHESASLLGGVVGAGFLLVDHVALQGQLVWVDDPEYRVTLAYRF